MIFSNITKQVSIFTLLLAGTICFLYGCANVVAPSGGPKDIAPPQIEHSTPENGTVNYKGKTIELVFDEMIKLDNINSKAIITPNINPTNIKYKSNKNRLIIELDSLQDSTTYSFSFTECIKDITENNSQAYQYAFSTGPYLDSISISGTVKSPGGSIIKDASVALYQGKMDTTNLKAKPMYLTKVKDGSYKLNNLKNNTYTQLVWVDDNKNGTWDRSKEKVSFKYPVKTDTNTTQDFSIYKYDEKPPKHSYNQKFNLTTVMNFDEPIMSFSCTPYIPFRINKEQIELYSSSLDTMLIQFTATDSSYNVKSDTTTIEFKESKLKSNFDYRLEPESFKVFDTVHLLFNKPIKTINKDSITINTKYKLVYDTTKFRISIIPEENYDTLNIKFAKATFISLHGDSTRAQKHKLFKANPEDYGSISYIVMTSDSSFILQLMSRKGLIATTINKRAYTFTNLEPDNYTFIYYQDSNNNGHWDHGDILNNVQPEKITFLNKALVLKANWEIKDHKIDTSEQK